MLKRWRRKRFTWKINRLKQNLTVEGLQQLIVTLYTRDDIFYEPYVGASLTHEMNYPNIETYLTVLDNYITMVESGEFIKRDFQDNQRKVTVDDYFTTRNSQPVDLRDGLEALLSLVERLFHVCEAFPDKRKNYYNRQSQVLLSEGVDICDLIHTFTS